MHIPLIDNLDLSLSTPEACGLVRWSEWKLIRVQEDMYLYSICSERAWYNVRLAVQTALAFSLSLRVSSE